MAPPHLHASTATARRRRVSVLVALGLLVGVLAAVSPLPTGPVPTAQAASTIIELQETSVRRALGDDRIQPGEQIQWRNRSGRTMAVTSPDGVLDSGPIPDGGSFYASLPVARSYAWETEVGSGLFYSTTGFDGADWALANDSIPDLPPPPVDPADVALHPDLRIEVPRNRLIVGFTDDATVEQAKDALRNEWVIIGGLPRTKLVYVEQQFPSTVFPTTPIASLRAKQGVKFASLLLPLEEAALTPVSSEAVDLKVTWEDPSIAPLGLGPNFGLEMSRVPQAWNLNDSLRAAGAEGGATTIVVDNPHDVHDDLDRLEITNECIEYWQCQAQSASEPPDDHGNHVAGIIGADHDAWGTSGVDPFSRLIGFTHHFDHGPFSVLFDHAPSLVGSDPPKPKSDVHGALNLLTESIALGRIPAPDVINLSIQNVVAEAADWWAIWDGKTCGPGYDDDAAGTGVCFPDTEDTSLREYAQTGLAVRTQVEALITVTDDPPLLVAATGNYSAMFCAVLRGSACVTASAVPQSGSKMGSPFAWAARNWDTVNFGADPPILLVESIGLVQNSALLPSTARSPFSNIDGDIAAPGWIISAGAAVNELENQSKCRTGSNPVATTQTYCILGGTSMATPFVAGVAGLALAADPTLGALELKQLLLRWARADTTDGAMPRVDAFATVLSLPDAARRLVDVNDPSADGNRRVIRSAAGVSVDIVSATDPEAFTEPDGVVDLRDFRRFRDSWLLRCSISPEAGCPTAIVLDGTDDHPKRDLNLDGCIALVAPAEGLGCPSELTFPRTDFNGDGTISSSATSLMPLDANGAPAAGPGSGIAMTDLDVLQSQWDAGAAGSMSVAASALDGLMISGDITASVASLRAATASSEVSVRLLDATSGALLAETTIDAASTVPEIVLTAPAGANVLVSATGVGPTAANAGWGPFTIGAGEDCVLETCAGVTFDGPSYDVEAVAFDGSTSGYLLLEEWASPGSPIGPSVNSLGDVAYGGRVRDDDRYRVFIAPTGAKPAEPATTEQGVGTATDEYLVGNVELNDSRQVAYTVLSTSGGEAETTIRRSTGTTTVTLDTGSTADSFTGPFVGVDRPTMNASGRVIHVGSQAGFVKVLAEGTSTGVVTGLETVIGLRPRLADDGTTVTTDVIERQCTAYPERTCTAPEAAVDQFFDTMIMAGTGVQASVGDVIAEQRVGGWGGLSEPDISESGDAIAFTAERFGVKGLFVALRDPDAGWQPPVAVAGPAAGGAITDVEGVRPNISQVTRGAPGPVDDAFVVMLVGSNDAPTRPTGVHAVRFSVNASTDASRPFDVAVEGADTVIEVGDAFLGSTVTAVRLDDAVAMAASPAHAFDHWVSAHLRLADGRNVMIRARSTRPPTTFVFGGLTAGPTAGPVGFAPLRRNRLAAPTAPSSTARSVAGSLVAAPLAAAPTAPPVLPGPHVAAVTVDDDTPIARVPTRVTNRSRTLDGTPTWAVLDETSNILKVLTNPVLLGPDESTTLELPDVEAPFFAIGAPVSAGGDANVVRFVFTVSKGANRPPTGEIIGAPFTIVDGEPLTVPVTSSDPDGDSRTFTWDLDDDGVFDDSSNFPPLKLTGAQVAANICGGTCTVGAPNPIAVRVLDARGLDTVVRTTVTVIDASALDVRVQPTLIRINPGSSGTVYLDAIDDGAAPPVELATTTEGLPDGWSTNLSSTTTSGTTRQVRITVPASEAEGSFTFDFVSSRGTDVWRRPVTVATQFGLVPTCTTKISGTIRDESDAPLPNASVSMQFGGLSPARTGTDGTFQMSRNGSDPQLSEGFELQRITSWVVAADGYVTVRLGAFDVVCGGVTNLSAQLRPTIDLVGATVRVVEGIANPVRPARPIPTGGPVGAATVEILSTQGLTGVDGRYTSGSLPFESGIGTTPLTMSVRVSKAGYWSATRTVPLAGIDPSTVLDFGEVVLLAQCAATVTGGLVVDQNGAPVEGASITIGGYSLAPIITEADGSYRLDREFRLGTWNQAISLFVSAKAPAGFGSGANDFVAVALDQCGQTTGIPTLRLVRPPPVIDQFGDVRGKVTDQETSAAIVGARVTIFPAGALTGALANAVVEPDGSWTTPGISVGTDPLGSRALQAFVTAPGYWSETKSFDLPAGATGSDAVVVDVTLLRQQRVAVSGTVTDQDTGEPIADVQMSIRGKDNTLSTRTAPDGTYKIEDLLLDEGNLPFPTQAGASFGDPQQFPAATHWPVGKPFTLTAADDQVVDLQMLRVCASSSISGVVFDASNGLPIEGARVFAGGFRATTDADGRYRIEGLRPGQLNSPRSVRVVAQKVGFFDSSVDVFTVCGSDLIVDFGRPPVGFGTVVGTVVDDVDAPIEGVDVGTQWGDVVTTGPGGTFRFERAPLAVDGGPRTWTVRAVNGPLTLQQDVTVVADGEAEVTFRFTGSPPDPDPENRPPAAEIAPIGTIIEGDSIRFDAGASTDPDGDALSFAWTLLADNGSTIATGTGPIWSFATVDDLVATIRLVVSDAGGASTTIERPVTVVNASPSVTIDDVTIDDAVVGTTAPLTLAGIAFGGLAATTVELRASFTDPGASDTHTVTVDWGDGRTEPLQHAGGSTTGSHGYDTNGSFTIVVSVCDDDAGCASASRSVTVGSGSGGPTQPPPTPTPTPTPTVIVTEPSTPIAVPAAPNPIAPSPADPSAAPPGGDPNTTLPQTGSNPGSLLAAALGLILVGIMLALTGGGRVPAGTSGGVRRRPRR